MAATGDEALVGRVLDSRYVLESRIARGGMASVFLAQDTRLDRSVAVKVMHTGLGDDGQFTERFVREARSAAKLNHANVVSVFDQGSDGDVTYLVMEYVPGETLRDVLRREAPMPPRRALDLMEQILIALSAAHAAKIIHRDVKPENVLITPEGDIKVADFGLARAVSAATTATGGTLIGTVSYLAPEIVVNDGADARSDVYACGAMLYEMLTGLKPHSGETPIQVAYKHVHEDVGAPSAVVPGIPAYVDALVARTTARDRDQRSTDARVMLQQVRQVRRALDAGITDDPDLVSDLLPRPSVVRDDDGEPTQEVERPSALPPLGASSDDDRDATVLVGAGTAAAAEATLHWGASEPPPVAPAAGLHPPMGRDDYRQVRDEHPRSRRGRYLFIGALVLALLVAGLGYYIGVGRYDKAPNLIGLSLTQARSQADDDGFTLKVGSMQYSETAPANTVMSSSPKAGAKILPHKTLTVVVSRGKERYAIPALKGKSLSAATAALEKLHLTVGKQTEAYSESVDEGDVVKAADYATGALVKRDTAVDLVISKGKKPIDITSYVGKNGDSAVKNLQDAGFTVQRTDAFSDDVAKGVVIAQSPDHGTGHKGDTINVTVSKGEDLVTVPDTKGKTRTEAGKILRAAGFKVQAFGVGNFTVRSQSPDGGQKKRGSTVTITQVPF